MLPHRSVGQGLLGTAASFAFFTSVGAFTNVGPSVITGNIGTNDGALTGFPPGTVTGQTHVQNAVSAQAATDVQAAYTSLGSGVCGAVLGTTLGNNQVLTPNTYCLGAASTLTGMLTLDGQGNASALFIVRIDGAFATGDFSSVKLINGASWNNVYWRVNGRVDIGTSAVFKGTIVANGAISLLESASLQGRGLSVVGAIALHTNSTTMAAAMPLPVELTTFTAERQGEYAQLRWTTASEKNNAYFMVETSPDGRTFTGRRRLAGHGTSSQPHTYEWTDAYLTQYAAPVVYYRLQQVDTDSTRSYSPVRAMSVAPTVGVQLQAYPSPSQHQLSVCIAVTQAGPTTLRLTDALGHLVAHRALLLAPGSTTLALEETPSLHPGLYLLQVQQGAHRQTIKLVRE